jgi:hypothetical protein
MCSLVRISVLDPVTSSYTLDFESYVLIGHESALFHVLVVLPRFLDTPPSFSLISPRG